MGKDESENGEGLNRERQREMERRMEGRVNGRQGGKVGEKKDEEVNKGKAEQREGKRGEDGGIMEVKGEM